MPTSTNAPRRTLLSDRRQSGHRSRHRDPLLLGRLARHHLLAASLPGRLPMGRRPRGSHPGRPCRPRAIPRGPSREIRQRLEGGMLHALVNNAAISPKGDGGTRMGTMDTDIETWSHVFRVNFFAPIMMARGLMEELKAAKGSVVNVTSIAGSRVHPFAGAAYATSKAALASLTREMASDFGRIGVRVNSIAPGRDRHVHSVAGHREDRRSGHPDASARNAGRSGADHLCPVHGDEFLRERRRDPYQRRPARLMPRASRQASLTRTHAPGRRRPRQRAHPPTASARRTSAG